MSPARLQMQLEQHRMLSARALLPLAARMRLIASLRAGCAPPLPCRCGAFFIFIMPGALVLQVRLGAGG